MLNTWTIDLKLEFAPKIKSQDIVLVMDRSGSMEGDRLKNARKAANQFVDIILDDSEFDHENRIALINYSVGAKVDNNFTTDKASLKSNIDALTATGVTFTQLGLYEARKLLEGSTADEKIIVLLTDGAPTFAFGLNQSGTAKYEAGLNSGITETLNGRYRDSTVTRNASGTYTSESNSYIGTNSSNIKYRYTNPSVEKTLLESDFNYNLGQGSDMGGNGSQAKKIQKDNSVNKNYQLDMLDLFNTNIAEASIVKSKGNTLYTVALDLQNVARSEVTLKEMATSNNHYFSAKADDLEEKFKDIANTIRFPFSNMELSDPMGTGFKLDGNVQIVSGAAGGLSTTDDKITWDMSPTSFKYDKNTKQYSMHIRYNVVAIEDVLGVYQAADDKLVYTNGDTKFNYSTNGNNRSAVFPKPKVKPTILLVDKILLDTNDEAISVIDAHNQRSYEYLLNDLTRGNINGAISTQAYDVYILKNRQQKTITETAVVNDNIDRFIRTAKLQKEADQTSGTLLTGGQFTLDPESGINKLHLINKIDINHKEDFELTKDVKELSQDKAIAEKGDTLEYTITVKNNSGDYMRVVWVQDTLKDLLPYIEDTDGVMMDVNGTARPLADLIDGFYMDIDVEGSITITFDVIVLKEIEDDSVLELSNTATVDDAPATATIELVNPKIPVDVEEPKDIDKPTIDKPKPGKTLPLTGAPSYTLAVGSLALALSTLFALQGKRRKRRRD